MQGQALARRLGRVSLIFFSLAARWGWAGDGPCSAPSPAPPPPERGRLVLAEYQVWHGLPSHSSAFSGADWLPNPPIPRAYDSRDPAVILTHIAKARAQGIDGFVVDWYGPGVPGLLNEVDRAFMDDATCALFRAAEAQGFWVALLYDEGALRGAGVKIAYQQLAISDLRYGEQRYLSSPAYLRLAGQPALFVFPYAQVDTHLDWSEIRAALDHPVTLFDKDPNPEDPVHDAKVDGFYAWVQADWKPDGKEWGEGYLRWFYATMRSDPYAPKLRVAGVWAGFDDSLAPWGSQRFISRQEGRVWERTWALALEKHYPALVMIATWNDFEEGTDVEFGVNMVVDMEDPMPEVLLRSSPFQVLWDPARGPRTLQVYAAGTLTHTGVHPPGVFLSLSSGHAYELKLWVDGEHTLSKAVKVRRQDPIPSAVIVN